MEQKHSRGVSFLMNKWIKGRKPWSIASDILFIILIVALIVPSSRRVVLSGVSTVRTWISNPALSGKDLVPLDAAGWNWTLTDQQGAVTNFGALRGEVIFLNQWATWCPPCRAEMPAIERLYKDYGSRMKFVILTAEDPKVVKEFIEKQGYTFPVYFGQVAGTSLATRSIPSTVIINRAGEILVRRNGAFNWNAKKIRRLVESAGRVGNSIELPSYK